MKVIREEILVPYGENSARGLVRLDSRDARSAERYESHLTVEVEGREYHSMHVISKREMNYLDAIHTIELIGQIQHRGREDVLREIGKVLFPAKKGG